MRILELRKVQVNRLQVRCAALEDRIDRLEAALEPFANAAEKARKEKGDPAYGLRWDDFLRAQNCFTNDEQARADREQE